MTSTTVLLITVVCLTVLNLILLLLKIRSDSGNKALSDEVSELKKALTHQSDVLTAISTKQERTDAVITTLDPRMREEFALSRSENQKSLRDNREELSNSMREIRETVERQLKSIGDDNAKRLEEMRKTVDEKLQESVEKRFNESFKMISDRLEQVHRGLGEMQTLASGVGDLKRVLTNVKTRGNLGEIQLGAILEQMLSPEQYVKNASVRQGSQERVEFAVNLPGFDGKPILLPIDSKFPIEDYQRLLDAYEANADIDSATRQFESAVKKNAKDIRDKYINPPVTTDFAIMFVPTEGLYAEILRKNGLFELLQRDYKITVVGPTNTAAFLSSLQMGFRTLAIEKRSSEVWELLGGVKTEFGKFGDTLDRVKNKLDSAAKEIDGAGVRSRAIERRLRNVEALPSPETSAAEVLRGTFEIEA